ncbi:hypothetical protein [Streptomyces sp. NBC_00690]|nr:hypothetical protein [Streptomyces sp. NBC_00690]
MNHRRTSSPATRTRDHTGPGATAVTGATKDMNADNATDTTAAAKAGRP